MFFAGTVPGFHAANSFSSRGLISAIVVAPTTTIVALTGLNQSAWNFTSVSRVILPTDSIVPEPVSGVPYGVVRAVDQARQHPQRDADRLRALLLDLRERGAGAAARVRRPGTTG